MDTTRGTDLQERLDAIGIPKTEFAERAEIDRGTVDRALKDDPTMTTRTWGKIEKALIALEDELAMAEDRRQVLSTIEYRGAKVTLQGTPEDVAAAARKILDS